MGDLRTSCHLLLLLGSMPRWLMVRREGRWEGGREGGRGGREGGRGERGSEGDSGQKG